LPALAVFPFGRTKKAGRGAEGKDQRAGTSREKEGVYETLMGQVSDGVYLVDARTKCTVEANPAFQKMLGYEAHEITGLSLYDLVADTPENIDRRVNEISEEESAIFDERLYKRKDGSILNVEISANKVSFGGKSVICTVVRDITERKRNQTELRKSEKTVRAFLNATREPAFLIDVRGRLITMNDATAKRVGRPIKELVGLNAFELGLIRAQNVESTHRVIRSGESVLFEEECDGKQYLVTIYPVIADEEEALRIAVFETDISELRLTQKKLLDSEKIAGALLDATSDTAFLMDTRGTILSLNQAAAKALGGTVDTLIGSNIYELIPHHLSQAKGTYVGELLRSLKPVRFEIEAFERWYEAMLFPIIDERGEVSKIAAYAHDITERRNVEEKARENAETVQTLLDAPDSSFGLIDLDGTVLAANLRSAQWLGKKVHELVGLSIFDLFPPEISADRRERFLEVIKSKKPLRFEVERNGICFDHCLSPVLNGHGEVIRVAVLATDITERKARAKELMAYRDHLEQLVEERTAKLAEASERLVAEITHRKRIEGELSYSKESLAVLGNFASYLIHDLKNPLSGLKILADDLHNKLPADQTFRRYTAEIILGIKRMEDLVNKSLDFVKPTKLDLETVDLHELLSDALAMVSPSELVIEKHFGYLVGMVRVDPGKMKRVFANIILNSAQATPARGKLTVSTEPLRTGVRISFADTGEGIPEGKLDRIFTPFFTTREGGHGMGLAFAKQIVSAHAGEISVSSVEGEGTTVEIILPVH
jgi:PAS domain S-box-containing protein